MATKGTVFVGLSGGVDSSVAALRLQKEGYRVVGVFIKVWHPEFMVCNWEAERLDAMRVAAHLDIPFLTCDAEAAYRDAVARYFIDEYAKGNTPNPDVMCNKEVKFGVFLDFARERGADYIATGHYAACRHQGGAPRLFRGIDTEKDQSYFLWTLTNDQLAHILLPLGESTKASVRKEAAAAGLPTAAKKDSQGVCFLGHVDIEAFLSHYITLTPGKVLDTAGAIIGEHKGALIYTLGQRHGFTLTTSERARVPHYVIAKNLAENTIVVSATKPVREAGATLTLTNVVLREAVTVGASIAIQTRYRQTPFLAELTAASDESLILTPQVSHEAASAGQSCVLYDGDRCIGGGIIA